MSEETMANDKQQLILNQMPDDEYVDGNAVPVRTRATRTKHILITIGTLVVVLLLGLIPIILMPAVIRDPVDDTGPPELYSGLTIEFSTSTNELAVEDITIDETSHVTNYHVTTNTDDIWAMSDFDTGVQILKVPDITNDTATRWVCYLLPLEPDVDYDVSADEELFKEMADELESETRDVEVEELSFSADVSPIDDRSVLGAAGRTLCDGLDTFRIHRLPQGGDYEYEGEDGEQEQDDDDDNEYPHQFSSEMKLSRCSCSPVVTSYIIEHADGIYPDNDESDDVVDYNTDVDSDYVASSSPILSRVRRQVHPKSPKQFSIMSIHRDGASGLSRKRRQTVGGQTASAAGNLRAIDRYGRRPRTPAPRARRQATKPIRILSSNFKQFAGQRPRPRQTTATRHRRQLAEDSAIELEHHEGVVQIQEQNTVAQLDAEPQKPEATVEVQRERSVFRQAHRLLGPRPAQRPRRPAKQQMTPTRRRRSQKLSPVLLAPTQGIAGNARLINCYGRVTPRPCHGQSVRVRRQLGSSRNSQNSTQKRAGNYRIISGWGRGRGRQ